MRRITSIVTAILISFVAAVALHAQAQGQGQGQGQGAGRRATRAAAAVDRRADRGLSEARRLLSALLGRGQRHAAISRSRA